MLIKGFEGVVSLRDYEVNKMAKFKLIISDPATGKSTASEVEGSRAQALVGRSLGEIVDGSALGISRGRIMISGGCDKNGIPMRADVHGGVKKYIVLSSGPGFRATRHGERRRKLVRGRTVTDETYQINFTMTKQTEAEKPPPVEAKPPTPTPPPSPKPTKAKVVEKPKPKKTPKKTAKKSK
jgi:small subunit ribosomal protein S6e